MRRAAATGTVALTVALLLQLVRVVFPVLYDVREDVGAGTAVVWALGAFVVVPGVAALTLRNDRTGTSARLAVVGLAVARLAAQLVHPIPVWLAAIGVALGLTALVLLVIAARSRGLGAPAGVAVVAGLAIDTVLFGLFGTWDAIWQDGAVPTATGVALSAAAASSALAADAGAGSERTDAWPLVIVGPFLVLHALFLQSVAFATSEVGVPIAGGVAFVLLGDVLGVLMATALAGRSRGIEHVVVAIATVGAVAVLALVQGASVAVAQPLGSAAAATALVLALSAPADEAGGRSVKGEIGWFALGTTLFVGVAFAYQIDIDVPLPVPRSTWPIAAAIVVAMAALRRHRTSTISAGPAVVPVLGAVVVPLVLAVDLGSSRGPTAFGGTFRVLSWNIHTAVDGDGHVVLGDVLEVIRSQNADVVVLQEVGRGWPIAGQSDDLEWLARELDMEHVWAPAADGQFGNAILSTHPIELDRVLQLPYGEGPQERSAIAATVGDDPGLFVVGVHLQHGDRPATRAAQIDAVLGVWGDADAWMLAGDLNMQPGEGDLARFEQAGLTSLQDLLGDPQAPTARDPLVPNDRVDWIWATVDTLDVDGFAIARSDASDHLPLVVDVTP